MADSTPRVTYFDSFGGRAMAIRLAFHLGNVAFEDEKLSSEEFGKKKAAGEFPLGQLPVLTVGGKKYPQSHAALLFAARKAGLLPEDDQSYAEALSIVFTIQEAGDAMSHLLYRKPEDPELVKKLQGQVKNCLAYISKTLGDRETYGGEKLNIADVSAFSAYTYLTHALKELAQEPEFADFLKYGERLTAREDIKSFLATASQYAR